MTASEFIAVVCFAGSKILITFNGTEKNLATVQDEVFYAYMNTRCCSCLFNGRRDFMRKNEQPKLGRLENGIAKRRKGNRAGI